MLLPLLFLLQAPTGGPGAPTPAAVLAWAERRGEAAAPDRAADSLAAGLRARPGEAPALLALGTLERLRGRAGAARPHLVRLAGGNDDEWAAAAFSGLARLELERGSQLAADRFFREALRRARRAGDPALAAEAAIGLAAMAFRRDGPVAALALLDSAPPAPDDPRTAAQWWCERSFYTPYAGRAAESGTDVATGRRLAGTHRFLRRDALCQVAAAHLLANSAAPGTWIPLLDSAETTFASLGDLSSIAFIQNFRGFQALLAYDHPTAFSQLHRAAELADSLSLPTERAWASRHLGHLAWHLGDLALAERELDQGLRGLRAVGDDFGVAAAQIARVGVLTDLGRWREAREAYEGVQAYAARTGMVVFGAWAQLGLAALDLRTGDGARAGAAFLALQQGFAAAGLTAVARGMEYEIGRAALLEGDLGEAERRLRRHLAAGAEVSPLDRFSARSRLAEVFAARGELSRAARELEAATDELEALRATRTEPQLRLLAFQTRKGNDEGDLGFARLFHALATGGELDAAWELAERRRARELTDRILLAGGAVPAGGSPQRPLTELTRALGERRAALLAYVTGEGSQPTSAVLVAAGSVRVTRLAPLATLAPLLARVTEAAERGTGGAVAGDAGRALLPPSLDSLPDAVRTLVVVDDQGLHQVPFDLLQLGSGAAVVERFTVAHVPSATLLLALWALPAREGPGEILAIGDPTPPPVGLPGATAEALDRGGDSLGRLPGSAREALAVARYGRDPGVRIGPAATEAWFKRGPLDRYRVIHVASHAVVGEEWASRTAIALAPGEGEDGFVTPAELAALRLEADLVVLSGCRTARGMTVRGEGVLGLTAPLLGAGVRGVIATGWDVPDAGMVPLAEDLYRELAAGRTSGEALRAAKLAARARGRPAREWAAMRLTGDPFLLVPVRAPPPRRWPVLAAALALAATYGVMVRRRGAERTDPPPARSARTHHS